MKRILSILVIVSALLIDNNMSALHKYNNQTSKGCSSCCGKGKKSSPRRGGSCCKSGNKQKYNKQKHVK